MCQLHDAHEEKKLLQEVHAPTFVVYRYVHSVM